MKNTKRRTIALSLSLAMLLVACGTNSNTTPTAENDTSAAISTETVNDEKEEQESAIVVNQETALTVVASTDPIYDFTTLIGGDRVQVIDLMEGEGDAHHWEPSPDLLKKINASNLFLVSGAGLEEGWLEDLQASLSEKVSLQDMSDGVELKKGNGHHHHDEEEEQEDAEELHEDPDAEEHEEADDHDHEHGEEEEHDHEHGEFDPHYWMSPKAAAIQAKNIFEALVKVDPEGKEIYEQNYEKVEAQFDQLTKDFEEKLQPFSGRSVIVPHEAFAYLLDDYDIHQVGLEGMLAEGQPNAQKVAEVEDLAKKENIQIIFYEAYGDSNGADAIAQDVGATTEPIYTMEAVSKEDREAGENYFTLMQKNLDAIVRSFGEKK